MRPYIKTYEVNKKYKQKVLLVAGVHGDELNPIDLLNYFNNGKNRMNLECHSLTLYNGANPKAIMQKKRSHIEIPSNDLNRMFKSESDFDMKKSLTEQVEKHDVVIDIHSSPKVHDCCLMDNNSKHDNQILEWFENSNVKYIIRNFDGNTFKKYCLSKGKLATTVEISGMNFLTFDKEEQVQMIQSLISNSFKIRKKPKIKYEYFPSYEMTSTQSGMLYSTHREDKEFIQLIDISGKLLPKQKHFHDENEVDFIYALDSDWVNIGDTVGFIQPKVKEIF